MFDFLKKMIFILGMLLLAGCANISAPRPNIDKQAKHSSSFILLKTPVLRYADQGFVAKKSNKIDVQIYSNGVAAFKMDISPTKVCSGSGLFKCMSSQKFNMKYLNSEYPPDTLYKIFAAEAVFGGEGLNKTKNGFRQHIYRSKKYDIKYSVLNHTIVFHDTISNILIKIMEN